MVPAFEDNGSGVKKQMTLKWHYTLNAMGSHIKYTAVCEDVCIITVIFQIIIVLFFSTSFYPYSNIMCKLILTAGKAQTDKLIFTLTLICETLMTQQT